MRRAKYFLLTLLGTCFVPLSSCHIQKRPDRTKEQYESERKEFSEHNFDNGTFTFKDNDSIEGTWTFKCQDEGCGKTESFESDMFSYGGNSYGYEQLGKVSNYGSYLQAGYRELFKKCEILLDDYTTNITDGIAIPDYVLSLPTSAKNNYFYLTSQLAFYFVYDNPKYFFLANGFQAVAKITEGEETFQIAPNLLLNGTSFNSGAQRKKYNDGLLKLKKDFLATISTDDNDYTKIQKTHDFILEKIEYAYDASGKASSAGWAHTIAGAGIPDSTTGVAKGVCECYAKTFSYLTSFIGIDGILVTGRGGGGDHAWNYVKYNNEWYGIDCTWDDTKDANGEYLDKYQYFGQTKIKSDHSPVTSSYTSDKKKYAVCYTPPTLSSKNLTRPDEKTNS